MNIPKITFLARKVGALAELALLMMVGFWIALELTPVSSKSAGSSHAQSTDRHTRSARQDPTNQLTPPKTEWRHVQLQSTIEGDVWKELLHEFNRDEPQIGHCSMTANRPPNFGIEARCMWLVNAIAHVQATERSTIAVEQFLSTLKGGVFVGEKANSLGFRSAKPKDAPDRQRDSLSRIETQPATGWIDTEHGRLQFDSDTQSWNLKPYNKPILRKSREP